MFSTLITIGRRGQIVIPASVRRRLGIRPGDRLTMIQSGDQIVLRPLEGTLLDLRGSVSVSGAQDFSSIRRQVITQHARTLVEDEA